MLTSKDFATSWAYTANAIAPRTRSFTVGPERYSEPPVETWMMPSDSASANPRIAALIVCDDVQLTAGYANPFSFARSMSSE